MSEGGLDLSVADLVAARDLPPRDLIARDSAPACTKYVSATGSVNGSAALKTIQAGVNALSPGDTLCVAPGTYKEQVVVSKPGTAGMPITIRALDPTSKPLIDGEYKLPAGQVGNSQACSEEWEDSSAHDGPLPKQNCFSWSPLVSIAASYVIWDGIDVTRSRGRGIVVGNWQGPWCYGMQVRNSEIGHVRENAILIFYGDTVSIRGNRVHDAQDFATYDRGAGQLNWGGGIYEDNVNNVEIADNVVYHIFGEAVGTGLFETSQNIRVVGNEIYDNYAVNLYVQQSSHVVVKGNLIYMTGDPKYFRGGKPNLCLVVDSEGIKAAHETTDVLVENNIIAGCANLLQLWQFKPECVYKDFRIHNNTFFGLYPGGTVFSNGMTTLTGFSFVNNIVDATGGSVGSSTNVPGMQVHHNLWSTKPPANLTGAGDIVTSSAGLANSTYKPPKGGFDASVAKLVASSPARDKGTAIPQVTDDFFGTPRPQGSAFDIGAHEYK